MSVRNWLSSRLATFWERRDREKNLDREPSLRTQSVRIRLTAPINRKSIGRRVPTRVSESLLFREPAEAKLKYEEDRKRKATMRRMLQ
jgi:hypothetical protein